MGKTLTPDLVLTKSKCENLFQVKNLNLWGNEMEDMTLLKGLPNVEVLSLSVNKINTLQYFQSCYKLQELYLRKNCITNIQDIAFLKNLKNLKVLWLQDNPISDVDQYRQIVIKFLPHLQKLDNMPVTQDEILSAQQLSLNWGSSENQQVLQENQNSVNMSKRNSNSGFNLGKENNISQQQQFQDITNNSNAGSTTNKRSSSSLHHYQNSHQQSQQSHLSSQNQSKQNLLNSQSSQQQYINKSSSNQMLQQQQQQQQLQQQQLLQQQQQQLQQQQENINKEKKMTNDNCLCAVMALVKELDNNSLEIVKRDIERRLKQNSLNPSHI
ncbi:hypothetical protein PPERSA_04708 [Pseudocohnilembus persalinus]|uniref:Leucine-rich repeat n=1 Tax=Pseudocohnilembus persalinus TaxID=266149 RepID=A0A0V0R4T3_PSEPJ|nr:hypothetical protein PPERSA_04708 [Pseudocohnilembus persalinus]|eukprot:KRX09402.1 hypothetical protein PPERSA_04708 [Pseudocohnilembus persalinus]